LPVQKYLHADEVSTKSFYTAKYTLIDSGYMGQIVEWPEVITEGSTLEECRAMLEDALREMVAAYAGMKKELPLIREGGNHSIYSNGARTIPVKRHRVFDRITANELCKQAGLPRRF
jgi:predicted RNase H-like HicB family nuclease